MILVRMVFLENVDLMDLLVRQERGVLQVPRDLEDSRECLDPLVRMDKLVVMENQVCKDLPA